MVRKATINAKTALAENGIKKPSCLFSKRVNDFGKYAVKHVHMPVANPFPSQPHGTVFKGLIKLK